MPPYYPDQRIIARMTKIQREALLPEEAVGNVLVMEEQVVDIRQPVARGLIQARHVIIEARPILGNISDETLKRLLLVKERTQKISTRDAIAGRDAKRGKRIFAPIDGYIVHTGDGRIIMQETPQLVTIEAGVRGTVTAVYPGRGVSIEATGAQIQGVWGNGRNLIAIMRMEPPEGIANIRLEALDTTYKNEIIVTTKTLTPAELQVAEARNFGGLIAPSMDASLVERVRKLNMAVMLTEGFGGSRMSITIATLLQEFDNGQITLNAYEPRRWEALRPQIVVNRRGEEELAPVDYNLTLKRGLRVRVSRAPYSGQTGKIVELPDQPVILPNGLRVLCAVVELDTMADTVEIPLANLEFAGR